MKAEKKVKVGIVGAGAIAKHHFQVLDSFEDVEIRAVANRSPEPREKAVQAYNIPAGYADFEEMLAKENLDALLVLVNAENMMTVTEKCFEKGVPILMEKPPALTAKEARELATKAREKNVPIMVGLNRRFYSIYEKALKAIAERGPLLGVAIEAPERIKEEREIGKFSPELLDKWITLNGIHAIDLLCFFGGNMKSTHTAHRSLHEKRGDNFGALIKFSEGAIGHYISHWNSPGRWTIDLYGDGIRAHFEPLESGLLFTSSSTPPTPIEPDIEDVKFKPGLWRQNRYFIDRVKDKKPIAYPAASIDDAVRTMELIEKIAPDIVS